MGKERREKLMDAIMRPLGRMDRASRQEAVAFIAGRDAVGRDGPAEGSK